MKYLQLCSLENCSDPIKDFYKRFFHGRRDYFEGANIQIASGSNNKSLIIKRINSYGTSLGFEDYEIAHCTLFVVQKDEIVMTRYSECIGGENIDWNNQDEMAADMINYIKEHGLLQL